MNFNNQAMTYTIQGAGVIVLSDKIANVGQNESNISKWKK